MIDGGRQAAFAEEPLAGFGRIQSLAQHLKGHAAPVLQVLGFKDRAHAAAAEGARDAVVAKLLRQAEEVLGKGSLR